MAKYCWASIPGECILERARDISITGCGWLVGWSGEYV